MHSKPAAILKIARAWRQRGFAFCLLVAMLLGVSSPSVPGESAVLREYEIKAAYLYNFIKYIEWPPPGLPPGLDTITIGVLGENPFGPTLATLNGKMAKDRKLVVKENLSPAELDSCQILFVSPSVKEQMPEILNQLRGKSILTVSETEGFAQQGGIINFIAEKNKVRFEINTEAAKRTGFTISSELLKLAKVVKP